MPMVALGSAVFEVDGTIEDTLELLAAACNTLGAYETTTYRKANPYQSEGAKTLGYEIFLQLRVCARLDRRPGRRGWNPRLHLARVRRTCAHSA